MEHPFTGFLIFLMFHSHPDYANPSNIIENQEAEDKRPFTIVQKSGQKSDHSYDTIGEYFKCKLLTRGHDIRAWAGSVYLDNATHVPMKFNLLSTASKSFFVF